MTYEQEKERFEKQKQEWELRKELIIAKQELKSEIKAIKKKRKISTSKLIVLFLFINCSIIEAFTLYITLHSMNLGFGADFGPLSMLITSVVGEVIGFAIYSIKAAKENTVGGVVYDLAMMQNQYALQEGKETTEQNGFSLE